MSRRGRSGPAISLFSFQDIITSVTAIVTVITLLLALDLVQRKETETADSSGEIARDLAKRAAAAEAEAAQLKHAVESQDQLVQEVAATSPAALDEEIEHQENEAARLRQEQARLETQAEHLARKLNEQQVRQFDLAPLRQRIEATTAEAVELERQREAEQTDQRTVFALPKGFQKEGWLAVIDPQAIHVAPLGRAARPVKIVGSGLPLLGDSAAEALMSWIERNQLKSAYFLVLVRPEASRVFDEVDSLFAANSVSYGFDLIGADEAILHPERGAAP